jgi:polar amino acid transport system ATP-binding protein
VADRAVFMGEGQILEQGAPKTFFENPQHEKAKQFLNSIL